MDTATQEPAGLPSEDQILADLGDPGELSLDDAPPSPDATVEAQPEPSPDAVPAQAPTDDADQAQDAEPSPADPASPEAEPPIVAEPFAFGVDGKRVTVEGATVSGDTITLSREAWQRQVQPHLADRGQVARQRQQLEAQLQQKGARERQAEQFMASMQQAMATEESAIEWALKTQQDWDKLQLKAELEAVKAGRVPLEQAQAQREAEVTDEQVGQWLTDSLHTFLDRPQYRDVKADARFLKRTEARLADALPLILRRDAQGQIVADWSRFERILDAEAGDARESLAQTKRLKEIEAAAKANAQQATKPVPPTVASTGKPSGATSKTTPLTQDEYERELDRLQSGRELLI